MEITMRENSDMKSIFCLAISDVSGDAITKIVNNCPKPEDPGIYDIEFKVNGTELNFQAVIDRLIEIYNKCTMDDAKALVMKELDGKLDTRIGDAVQTLQETIAEIEDKTKELHKIVDYRVMDMIEKFY